jgi:hypothetical protein
MGHLDVHAKIILKFIVENYNARMCTVIRWLGMVTSGMLLWHCNGPSGCTRTGNFLDKYNNYELVKKDHPLLSWLGSILGLSIV